MTAGLNPTHRAGELHAAWQAGDTKAAAELIVRYRSRLRAFGGKLGLSEPDAEELAQEVLIDAHRSPFEDRGQGSYWGWLSVIARRRSLRIQERRDRALPARRHTTPWSAECRRRLLESILSMPTTQHEVFARLVRGYDPDEIATELGISRAAVYTRIHRGRRWLRDLGH